jgi:hypothetical protein
MKERYLSDQNIICSMNNTMPYQDETPKAVFTRLDYDSYLEKLRPYKEKVLDRKENLDPNDVTDLEFCNPRYQ